jgi:hypothetical protein
VADVIVEEFGPEIFFQLYAIIVPSGSLEPVPSNTTLSVGKTIDLSLPALAIGGLFSVIHS